MLHPAVYQLFGYDENLFSVEPIGSGLIHRTWKLSSKADELIVQQINHLVFQHPEAIAENINLLKNHLAVYAPHYVFTAPLTALNGEQLILVDGHYYRMFRFVKGSHTIDTVQTPQQAFEAAAAFGKFTKLLRGVDVTKLHTTLPNFHNLTLRYQQFEQAIAQGNPKRIKYAELLIKDVKKHHTIVEQFEQALQNQSIIKRVTHHDTKISNVLFNSADKAICVIDLDTVMQGYFFSDVGDMMRTYLSPVNEEETNWNHITIRKSIYDAVIAGYLSEMGDELTKDEKALLFFSGSFMIYMQSLRFLTDYLMDDVYYGASYELHNYNRAFNQYTLLKRYLEME
jgi:thiamine kinase-like enzyme